jgi:hypothetical protein
MEFISRVENNSYYKLTSDEIFLYRYMETLSYGSAFMVETDLVDDILIVTGGIIIQECVVRYFGELSKSLGYQIWLRKYKLNEICLKLVK